MIGALITIAAVAFIAVASIGGDALIIYVIWRLWLRPRLKLFVENVVREEMRLRDIEAERQKRKAAVLFPRSQGGAA